MSDISEQRTEDRLNAQETALAVLYGLGAGVAFGYLIMFLAIV